MELRHGLWQRLRKTKSMHLRCGVSEVWVGFLGKLRRQMNMFWNNLEVKQRQLQYFGHIKRHQSIKEDILEGKVEGKRARGRQCTTWTDNIKTSSKMTLAKYTKKCKNREGWRASCCASTSEPEMTKMMTHCNVSSSHVMYQKWW